jgi:transcriptional regulator with XRE-family HTH domain
MITGTQLRAKRNAAGIAGSLVCVKAGIARSRLSDIEREYVAASEEELARTDAALDELIQAKAVIDTVATSLGWPMGGHRDH